jgi:CMP/dCMP kinase
MPQQAPTIMTDGNASASERPADQAIIITIDGPAGTGKSTLAHRLATRLGLEFLDTGAMYRAAALVALERGIDPQDGPALRKALGEIDLHFDWNTDPPRVMLDDRDVTGRIRDLDVSGIVSQVAAQPEVRKHLVQSQQEIATRHPRLVSEGRDQGSVVFPDAPVRFFLHADVAVRADRRMAQLLEAGKSDVDKQRIMRDIEQRDEMDSSRSDGPLIRPHGAIDIDTSHRTVDEVVTAMEAAVRSKLSGCHFVKSAKK